MELKIKPFHKNTYPLGGILIKDPSVSGWVKEIQALQWVPEELEIYPIPGSVANTVWGCLLVTHKPLDVHRLGKHEVCQRVSDHLFIPERAVLYPPMSIAETSALFHSALHIIHPEFGLAELPEALDLKTFLQEPVMRSYFVTAPEPAVFIPGTIRSFQVQPVAQEELMKQMEEKIFPKKEAMKDESLSLVEKTKLFFYKLLFKKEKNKADNSSTIEKTSGWSRLQSFINSVAGHEPAWANKMQQDFEDLERRNQKELDKLLDLLKKNPMEALRYAIPIDESGTGRGGGDSNAEFNMSKRWFSFSLFEQQGNSGAGSINLGDENVNELRKQYNATAEQMIKAKEYHNAAFIYMKLLKNYHKAAEALELGGFYQEAAVIYLKHAQNKEKAAECYEKGNMINDAIGLYKEMNRNEKVGDLYASIHKQKEADVYFEKVVDEFKLKNQYVKAALIYKNKMHSSGRGQALLLEGWKTERDAFNCLNNYFANIGDTKALKKEITEVYVNDLNAGNSLTFLQVIQVEYKKNNDLAEYIKEMAYEVIAAQIGSNPDIVTEMKAFNKNDKELVKDAFRFRLRYKK